MKVERKGGKKEAGKVGGMGGRREKRIEGWKKLGRKGERKGDGKLILKRYRGRQLSWAGRNFKFYTRANVSLP